jgi:thioredoxin-dependent peroxiredoxin
MISGGRKMTIWRYSFLLLLGCLTSFPALAALQVGDAAPNFSADAAVGGKHFRFSLKEALSHGPVVLYFFPKAFTSGCTVEAHEFSEAAKSFTDAGATLIGMSSDDIDTLSDFSTRECRAKFPVAADPDLSVIRAYDAVMMHLPGFGGISDRTSYVISPDGKILVSYTAMSPDEHVSRTLAAVQQWQKDHAR